MGDQEVVNNQPVGSHCDMQQQTRQVLRPDLSPRRKRLIRLLGLKAFNEWKDLCIGLEFTEVADHSEAEVRIAFDQADGSWSCVGRDVLGINANEPTTNFGWDLTDGYGRTTALHESAIPCTRRKYEISTFGTSDTVLVLFEHVQGELGFRVGGGDGGEDRNSRVSAKLFQGRRYAVRVKPYWAGESGQTAIMRW